MQGLDSTARAVLLWQLALAGIVASLWLPFGLPKALAALAGSAISIVPTALTYVRSRAAFTQVGLRDPHKFVQMVNRAQVVKFALTTLMLVLAMANGAEHFFAIMAGFTAGLAAYWVVMARAVATRN
ncbi:MAG: ATP synthase subunit I [Oceanococcaceae bacterium]